MKQLHGINISSSACDYIEVVIDRVDLELCIVNRLRSVVDRLDSAAHQIRVESHELWSELSTLENIHYELVIRDHPIGLPLLWCNLDYIV